MKPVSTGGLPFRRLIEEGYCYVDKTLLVSDVLDAGDGAVLAYIRPRRFGKTTNLTMLDAFLNIEYRGNRWFDGLAVSQHPEYDGHRNAYAVIRLDMMCVNPSSRDGLTDSLNGAVIEAMDPFADDLVRWDLGPEDRRAYERICTRTATEDEIIGSVAMLRRIIHESTGLRTVVLVDEFDTPVTGAFRKGTDRGVVDLYGMLLSSSLSPGPDLRLACVTGVAQVAEAILPHGVITNTVLSHGQTDRFGFTEPEVRRILEQRGHPERLDEVREWYGGYRIGDAEVYNPFSVMMYVQKGFVPESYWRDSGRNLPVVWMMQRVGSIGMGTVSDLINGEHVVSDLHRSMSYEGLRLSDPVDLFPLMVMTGYLVAVPRDDGLYELSIPNREVMGVVDSLLSLNRRVGDEVFARFNAAVLDGDVDTMVGTLQSVLSDGSYFSIRDESSYVNIVLTMLHGVLRGYRVRSQLEPGNGRADIVLEPRRDGDVPIVIELKVSATEADLDRDAASAVAQIRDRGYHAGMGDAILIGLAFRGKTVRGRVERSSA